MKTLRTLTLYTYIFPVFIGFSLISCAVDEDDPINLPPIARIVASTVEGTNPLIVEFDAASSSDPEQGLLSYHWDFGDGKSANSVSASNTYTKSGSYYVKLTVTDEGNLDGTAEITIKVDEPMDLFPLSENAQWVYKVVSEEAENGSMTGYEEGTMYITVVNINHDYDNTEFIELRITGKKYYNSTYLGDRIYLANHAGSSLSITHDRGAEYKTYIDLNNTSWSGYAMFFSNASSQNVTISNASANIGIGNFEGLSVKHANDNWGENYVSERYDVTEKELYNPQIGLIQRQTTRYVAFLDCFTCPVYTGSSSIELTGYYIPQDDGSVLQGGTGYNPNNPYGGDLGQLTVWTEKNFGIITIYLDNEKVGQISNYWSSGVSCDQAGACNISNPQGTYNFRAESSQYSWKGTVYFTEGICNDLQLVL